MARIDRGMKIPAGFPYFLFLHSRLLPSWSKTKTTNSQAYSSGPLPLFHDPGGDSKHDGAKHLRQLHRKKESSHLGRIEGGWISWWPTLIKALCPTHMQLVYGSLWK